MPAIDLADALLVAAIFALGGLVKGVAGFGLPSLGIGLLALTRPLPEAIALMLLPTLATNAWQAFAGGALRPVLRRLRGFLPAAALGTLAGAFLLGVVSSRTASGVLGGLLTTSAALALFGPAWPIPSAARERWLAPLMGLLSGVGAGLTGSFVVPAVPFLAALRLGRDELVQAFGLGAVISTAVLAATLAGQRLLPPGLGLASAAVLVPTFAGMATGRRVRGALSDAWFRRVVQSGLLLLGGYLVARAAL